MAIRSVGFQLRTDGKAEVKNDFAEVRSAGQTAMDGVAKAAEDAAERAGRASDAYTERQIAGFKRQADAAKVAAAAALSRAEVDRAMATASGNQYATVNLDRSTGAARASADVFEQSFAATRALEEQAKSAAKLRAALDPVYAAQVRYDDELRTANSLLSQGAITEADHAAALRRSADAYREVADAAGVAAERQQALWAEEAAAARQEVAARNSQSAFSRVGDATTGKSARDSASVFQEEDARAATLAKIRAAIDPLSVAQARYDEELRTYDDLLKQGQLTEREHGQAVAWSTQQLHEARIALDGHSQSAGFNRVQMMMLRSAAFNASSSIAAGMPIYRVLIEQGLEVGQALTMGDSSVAGSLTRVGEASRESGAAVAEGSSKSAEALGQLGDQAKDTAGKLVEENGVKGALSKVMSVLTPTRLLVGTTAIAVIAGAKAWLDYSNNVAKLNAVALGSGRLIGMTGTQLEASAEAAARAGDMSVSAAREIQAAFVEAGDISGSVLTGVTALAKDFAAATGQDAAGAAKALGAAFADPINGADELATKYGVLSQSQVERIQHLVQENDLAGAQRVLLEALVPAFAGAADGANVLKRAWDGIKDSAHDAWNWMGKALDRMATGGSLQDQIADLQAKRAVGPSWGQMRGGLSAAEYQADIDKQIAGLRDQMRQEAARSSNAKAASAQAQGMSIVDAYTGANQLGDYRKNVGKLQAALKTDMPPEQRQQLTETLDAYTHAIDTFIPKQEKANQIAAIDAKLAATKVPAERAALAAQKARLEASGQVITAANVETQATAAGERARAQATKTGDKHAAQLAREAQSMEVSARAALDVADAYLKSSAAGVTAEARRKALTDATRRGIDVDAQVRRQMAVNVAEGIADGAKSVAQLRDETTARQDVLEKVAAGTLSVDSMNEALADEAALRPLLKLQALAQGDALAALTKVIDAYRAALGEAHAAERSMGLETALRESVDRAEELKAQVVDLAHSPLDAALNAANRAANRDADKMKLADGSPDRVKFVRGREEEAENDYLFRRAKFAKDALDAQADQLETSRLDLQLIGASDEVRGRALEKLRLEQTIRRQFPDLDRDQVNALLAGVDAQTEINAQLKITAAALDEVRGFGADFVDTVLSEDTWSSWSNAGKTATNLIREEFLKLALINPLKNLINGNSNLPTLMTSLSGLLGGGLAGKSAALLPSIRNGANSALAAALPGNATGTASWAGGLTWVNENGPEIADLPNGTRIYPAAETRRMLAGNDNGGGRGAGTVIVQADGSVLTDQIRSWIFEAMQMAAAQGADGGAKMSEVQGAQRAARRLGGRW